MELGRVSYYLASPTNPGTELWHRNGELGNPVVSVLHCIKPNGPGTAWERPWCAIESQLGYDAQKISRILAFPKAKKNNLLRVSRIPQGCKERIGTTHNRSQSNVSNRSTIR
jgi:hypothetical protein